MTFFLKPDLCTAVSCCVGKLDSWVQTYVPGFWSLKGDMDTVLTLMIAAACICRVELTDLWEIERGGRDFVGTAVVELLKGGDQGGASFLHS